MNTAHKPMQADLALLCKQLEQLHEELLTDKNIDEVVESFKKTDQDIQRLITSESRFDAEDVQKLMALLNQLITKITLQKQNIFNELKDIRHKNKSIKAYKNI
jgi:succinate dehydrogenase flavin-adding protein (antitoxin of CptAB toxin-antitoxin module)